MAFKSPHVSFVSFAIDITPAGIADVMKRICTSIPGTRTTTFVR